MSPYYKKQLNNNNDCRSTHDEPAFRPVYRFVDRVFEFY